MSSLPFMRYAKCDPCGRDRPVTDLRFYSPCHHAACEICAEDRCPICARQHERRSGHGE